MSACAACNCSVRSGSFQPYTWRAELLEALPPDQRPTPFIEVEHIFTSLDELCGWLGDPEVKTNNRHGDAWQR